MVPHPLFEENGQFLPRSSYSSITVVACSYNAERAVFCNLNADFPAISHLPTRLYVTPFPNANLTGQRFPMYFFYMILTIWHIDTAVLETWNIVERGDLMHTVIG